MKPAEEQLKDPKWWDENAPEGAEVWVYCGSGWVKWVKWVNGVEFEFYEGLDGTGFCWVEAPVQFGLDDYKINRPFKFYTRPEPRPEPEWQPKVGDVCLARAYEDVWHKVELLRIGKRDMWVCYFETEESQNIFLSDDIRPLPKTPREQFVEKAEKQFGYRVDDLAALYDLAMEFK